MVFVFNWNLIGGLFIAFASTQWVVFTIYWKRVSGLIQLARSDLFWV
jgi:hypothetical protein